MLRLKQYSVLITYLLLIVTFSACKTRTVKPIEPILVPPTYSQKLVVKNSTPEDIFVFPAPGTIGTPLIIQPGNSINLDFIVNRLAVLDEDGNPLEHTWDAEIHDENNFIGMRDPDGLLLIKTKEGELWEYRISLGDCWFQNNPPSVHHQIEIKEDEPDLGIPSLILCD